MMNKQGRIPLRDNVRKLNKIYSVASKKIAREMSLLDIANYQELKAIKMQENIDQLINILNRAAMKWAKKSMSEAYEKAYSISKTQLEILGAKRDYNFMEKIHEQTIMEDTDETMNVLIKANQSIKQNVAIFLYLVRKTTKTLSQFQAFDLRDEEIISELLDDAIREGETRNYAANAVKDHFKQRFGEAQFININGRNYEMRAYADLVAKTRLRVVQTDAVLNSCKEFQNDLVQVSAHGTACLICEPYEGGIYSLSGKHPSYPYLDDYPPFHPRCQHSLLPTSEPAIEARSRYA